MIETNDHCGSCLVCASGSHRAVSTLEREIIEKLDTLRVSRRVARGTILFRQGDRVDRVYCISETGVKLSRQSPSGRQTIIGLEGPGAMLGLAATFGSGYHPYTGEALDEGESCEIPSQELIAMADETAPFARRLLHCASIEVERTTRQIGLATGAKLGPKLAALLLQLSRLDDAGDTIVRGLTRQDLAKFCAVSNEALVRCLGSFKQRRIVETTGRAIRILDRSRLEEWSQMA